MENRVPEPLIPLRSNIASVHTLLHHEGLELLIFRGLLRRLHAPRDTARWR